MTTPTPEAPRRHTEHSPRPNIEIRDAIDATMTRLEGMKLPIMPYREQLATLIEENDTVILIADTGSGKTIGGPLFALDGATKKNPNAKVVVTQPRRLPTESLDNTMSETMGNRVGYRHGNGRNTTPDTQLEFAVAASVLNTATRDDPLLLGIDVLVLDEAHERNIDTDILMGLAKKIQKARQDDMDSEHPIYNRPLKLLITSGTIDKDKFLGYFPNSKSLEVPGRIHEITDSYAPEKIEDRDMPHAAAKKAMEILAKGEDVEPGDMLIFMPGQSEIEDTIAFLKSNPRIKSEMDAGRLEIDALMGGDNSSENAKKLANHRAGVRRIFVSTNVAETSLTIEGLRIVIDSGLMRQNIFDPITGISTLETIHHTRSNAKQRRGRAGRTDTGTAHFLFTKEDFDTRPEFIEAEILRIDLTAQILKMKKMGIPDIIGFDFLDHPGKDKINRAMDSLFKLGALNSDGSLNEIGNEMAEISAEPHLARMIVEAKRLGCEDAVALVAGMIQNSRYDVFLTKSGQPSLKDNPKYARFIDPTSDIITRLKVWNEYLKNKKDEVTRQAWETTNELKTYGFKLASDARKEMLNNRGIKDLPIDLTPEMIEKIHLAVSSGLISNLLTRSGGRFNASGGITNVQIDGRSSVLSGSNTDSLLSAHIRSHNGRVTAGLNFLITSEAESRIKATNEIVSPLRQPDEQPGTQANDQSSPGRIDAVRNNLSNKVSKPISQRDIILPHFKTKEEKEEEEKEEKKDNPAQVIIKKIKEITKLPGKYIRKLPFAHDTELVLHEVRRLVDDPKERDKWDKPGGGGGHGGGH